jgi:hypothetical protein
VSKKSYVLSKRGTPSFGHTCHWPGCNKEVPPAMWGCAHHWFALPKTLRDKVWAAYRRRAGGSGLHHATGSGLMLHFILNLFTVLGVFFAAAGAVIGILYLVFKNSKPGDVP